MPCRSRIATASVEPESHRKPHRESRLRLLRLHRRPLGPGPCNRSGIPETRPLPAQLGVHDCRLPRPNLERRPGLGSRPQHRSGSVLQPHRNRHRPETEEHRIGYHPLRRGIHFRHQHQSQHQHRGQDRPPRRHGIPIKQRHLRRLQNRHEIRLISTPMPHEPAPGSCRSHTLTAICASLRHTCLATQGERSLCYVSVIY